MKLFLPAMLVLIGFSSCNMITGSGRIITEKRTVQNFNEIETSGSISIEVSYGDKLEVEVESDDNIVPHIKTTVDDGRLSVAYEEGSYKNVHAKVYVHIPVVRKLLVSGSGDIVSTDTLMHDEQIDLKINGSGSIEAVVNSPKVKADIDGSGSINVKGRTRSFTSDNSGSGSINASGLLSETAVVKSSGSGSTHLFASVSLEADLNGSGDIVYDGNPPSAKIDDDGSGNVRKGK